MDSALDWTSDDEFAVDGISYVCRGVKVGMKSTADRFCIIKPRWQIERYDQLIREPEPCGALESFVETCGLRDAVATYYGVDQADTQKLAEILDREYQGEPLDLVVDDASHLVVETRRSFNFLFPHLAPGGAYVIEDWSWAHTHYLPLDGTPLSVLVSS
jgi:hypothetical protein